MKACGKSMLHNHQELQKRRETINRRHDKEKKIPKIIIRSIEGELKIVNNSLNSNNFKKVGKGKRSNVKETHTIIAHSSNSNEIAGDLEDCSSTIGEKVKLCKRGLSCTSDAPVFEIISNSSLPEEKRRKINNFSFISSSVSPSPTTPPVFIETRKAMDYSEEKCNKSPIPSLISKSKATDIFSIHFHDYVQYPSLNSKTFSTFDDNSIANSDVSSDCLPSKKTKRLENYPFINDKGPSATCSLFDIDELEVASYEEVSSVEPPHTSSEPYPRGYFGVNDVAVQVHTASILQEINSTSLPKEEKNPVLNTEKIILTHSEVSNKEQKRAADGITIHDHHYPITINEAVLKDIFEKELKDLDLSVLVEFFYSEELSVAEKRTDDYISKIVDLAFEIEKQHGMKNKESSAVVLSKFKHSTEARLYIEQIITDFQNKLKSRDNVKVFNKRSSSSTAPLSFRNGNGVFKQENYATKEREKKRAMDGRCIVFVGNIPHDYSPEQLRRRFQRFGSIKGIQIKSKVKCDLNNSDGHSLGSEGMRKFGFITFSCNQEASDAIEGGNKGHKLKFHLSFGARRQFVGEEYRDLDGIVAKNENWNFSRSSYQPQEKQDEDFDDMFKNYMKDRGVKPQPFRMKCKA